VSVPANLAEGVGRNTRAETGWFAAIAVGSLYELDTLLEVAAGQGYPVANLPAMTAQLIRQTSAFAQHQRLVATRQDPQATSHRPQAGRA
jgi:four helix bundle protein